jgi:hypothetical protein
MRSRRTARFKSLFEELPAEVRQSAQQAYVLFQCDPAHPSLAVQTAARRPADVFH